MDAITVELRNPIAIVSNFDVLKLQLSQELEKYNLAVTEETLPGAKKAVAELRDLQKKIDRARIDYTRQFTAPISAWADNAKALVQMAREAEEKIVAQVKVFEDRTRALCADLMRQALASAYDRLEVRPQFRTGAGSIEQLVGTSKVTGGGALTKAARESIDGLAQQGRIAQDRVDGRLATLEAECLKAGLAQPMTPESVTHLLGLDDVGYRAGLERMIRAEIDREARAKRAVIEAEQARIRAEERAKAEAEARIRAEERAKEEAQARARQAEENRIAKEKADQAAKERAAKETAEPAPTTQPAPLAPKAREDAPRPALELSSRVLINVVATFEAMASRPVNVARVRAWYEGRFAAAGITDPHAIEVIAPLDEVLP